MMFYRRIVKLFDRSQVIDIKKEKNVFIYSDCHRGAGDGADDFKHNRDLFLKVIKDYISTDFLLVELGDGDELWENNSFEQILKTYSEIYKIYNELSLKGKFYYLWGNHNRKWKSNVKFSKRLNNFFKVKNHIKATESLVLKYENKKLFLLHGHQGELINDRLWWIGKFFVKTIWRRFQIKFGLPDLTSPAKNYKARIRVDKRFINLVRKINVPVIIGHTHRPMFPKTGQYPYFNTGCCIHPDGITGIEIINGSINLVEWKLNKEMGKIDTVKKFLGGPLNIV